MESLIERTATRKIQITPGINPYAAGSVLVEYGNTKIHVTANWEEGIPRWLKDTGKGWVTAEYSMLPGATHTRNRRERKSISGRSQEIQRLIGRSLRSIVNLKKLGERSLVIDCDVLVADGGTRTASISGGFVALKMAVDQLLESGVIKENPINEFVAALSVGITPKGRVIADLNYEEDSTCDTDMNIVMTESGRFVEVQGTAEGEPFTKDQLQALLSCSHESLKDVFLAQKAVFAQ